MMNLHCKYFFTACLLFVLSINTTVTSQTNEPYTVTDDFGNEVEFTSSPQRVITLAPNLTELIYTVGAEKFLIGNTIWCDYPAGAKEVTNVGDMLTFDYEKILTLKPDLIFITVEGNTKATYDKFIEFGFKLFISNPRNYKGIKKTVADMGKIFQKEETADSICTDWDKRIEIVTDAVKDYPQKSVMIIVELTPIMLAGKTTFLNEFTNLFNLKNISRAVSINYPVFSREQVLSINPEIIIYPSNGTFTIDNLLEPYKEWESLSAVKNDFVLFVNRDLYFRPGSRFVEAVEDLYSILHSKMYRARN